MRLNRRPATNAGPGKVVVCEHRRYLALAAAHLIVARSRSPGRNREASRARAELDVEQLVDEALRNNPEILAARGKAQAVREKVPQAGALEDPMLGVGVTNLPTNFSFEDDDMTQKEVSVTQKLPFPGKRGLAQAMTEKEAEAAEIEVAEASTRIVREVKTAYYELSHVYRAMEVTRRNQQTVEGLVRIAEARYALGTGMQQELIAAQLEISRMLDELLMLDQSRLATEARLEALLNREVTGSIGRPAAMRFNRVPLDARRLQQAAVESNLGLMRMRKMIEAQAQRGRVRRARRLPGLRAAFQLRPARRRPRRREPQGHGLGHGRGHHPDLLRLPPGPEDRGSARRAAQHRGSLHGHAQRGGRHGGGHGGHGPAPRTAGRRSTSRASCPRPASRPSRR